MAAVALASCSNDETVAEYQGEAISFRPFVNNVTRAADITDGSAATDLQGLGFWVTAIHSAANTTYINDQHFTWDGTSSTYTSTPKYYWPATGTLEFFAYAPTAVSNAQLSKTSHLAFTVTPSQTIAQQIDLVYANTDGKTKTGTYTKGDDTKQFGADGVPLNFRHTGSKIVIKVKNSVENNLKFEITGWKLANVDGQATFTYNNAAVASSGDETTDTKNAKQLLYEDWSNNTVAVETEVSYTSADITANVIDKQQTTAYYLKSTGGTVSGETTTLSSEVANEDQSLNMILIPQRTSATTQYSGAATNDAATTGSYIALKMVIKNSSDDVVIADASTTVGEHTKWAMWPVAFTWDPGKKYTYTIDLAGGGYWEINDDTDQALDPILENAEIKFVDVTVDNWIDATGIADVTGGI